MTLDQLIENHQRALSNARHAGAPDEKLTYFDLVEYYAKRIRERRHELGLPRYRQS